MTGCVGDLEREDKHERSIVGAGQEVTDIPPDFVMLIQECQTKCSGNVGAKKEKDEFASIIVWEAVVEIHAKQYAKHDQDAIRNLHQSRNQCTKPKSLYDNGAKIRDPTIGHIRNYAYKKEEVEFRVEKRLHNLIGLLDISMRPRRMRQGSVK